MPYQNLDAASSVFFERELESMKPQAYDVVKAPLKAFEIFPVSTDAGAGAEVISYKQYDTVGMAKVIANYADDLPRSDVTGVEFFNKVKSIGGSYGYSLQELRAAQFAGKPLEVRKMNATIRSMREAWNKVAFYGDAENGLKGLLSNNNIPKTTASGAGSAALWVNKTPDQILTDLNKLANDIVVNSNGAEIPDTIVLPISAYTLIASTARSANSDTTILDYFLTNNPYINTVDWANELSTAQIAANGIEGFTGSVAFAYRKSPDVLTLEMPQLFEMLPAQERNLEYVVPCHSRIGGVIVYYPLACGFLDGFTA